ncbi:hypothetical protein [Pseudomonas sp. IT-347P]|uniref:hypothetical protein n=1 Tax=Pseudomonas sp. IT-347P TaxID=3026458 RepID=UPI0039E033DC
MFIEPELVKLLKNPDNSLQALRYDKRGKAYADMEGGTVMIALTEDGYRQTHAQEMTPSGARMEQIPGTRLWRPLGTENAPSRHTPVDINLTTEAPLSPSPGPSKRARISEPPAAEPDTDAQGRHLFERQPAVLDVSANRWRQWGTRTKPETGQAIEIDGLHYRIMPQDLPVDTGLVYLQHPDFAPDRFDTFEHMLRHSPLLQPLWALKRDGQWRVMATRLPFEMPASQYVARAFEYLADHSATAIARSVFDYASHSSLTGRDLSLITQTFHFWLDRVNNTAPDRNLADPLLMLPILPTRPDNLVPGGILTLPPPHSEPLQRLDFDRRRLPLEWAAYTASPTPGKLREVFRSMLQHSGYSPYPSPRTFSEGALIFHREGIAAVFVLRFPVVLGDSIPRHVSVGSEPGSLGRNTGSSMKEQHRLAAYLGEKQVIHLVGGIQYIPPDQWTPFIARER